MMADCKGHRLLSADNRKLIPRLDKCLTVLGIVGEISKISVKLNTDFQNRIEH